MRGIIIFLGTTFRQNVEKNGEKKEEYDVKIFLFFQKKHGQISRIFLYAFRL
jgi:hypothetical protein